MSSASVDVTVRSAGTVVDGLVSRPVRLLPTGHAGVVYGGVVYPLRTSNVIDLEDDAYDKFDCGHFVESGTSSIPYSPPTVKSKSAGRKPKLAVDAWYVEQNQYGNYLVFDADEDTAQAAADLMVEIGLGVRRWDASSRAAADGHHYDWFIRLEYDGPRDECARLIEAALSAPVSVGTTVPASSARDQEELADLRSRVRAFEARRTVLEGTVDGLFTAVEEWRAALDQAHTNVSELEDQLRKARATERGLRQNLANERHQREQAETSAKAFEKAARGASQEDVAAAVAAVEAHAADNLAKVRADLEAAVTLMDDAEQTTEVGRRQIASHQEAMMQREAELRVAQSQIEHLQNSLNESANTPREREIQRDATRRTPRGRVTVDQFLKALMPRLDLDQDGLDTLLGLEKPRGVVDILFRVEANDPTLDKEVFDVKPLKVKIWEVQKHSNIGQAGNAAMGRVYYHVASERVRVFVQRKTNAKGQAPDVKEFARRCQSSARAATSNPRPP
jgi:hypothetical protein